MQLDRGNRFASSAMERNANPHEFQTPKLAKLQLLFVPFFVPPLSHKW
jgi:hypothetical protein